ncbi:PREDICTED: centrosomal protein of 152 kDa-like isoform X2 [Cyphomyrmex costatus]|uniref:centrosomal protein of 152 kDa-like isoform X2 n=1 Tax=Cyphomyrmex costatus TaxID=456900 RepID=UPI0008521D1B|nr:PREDICTED: centrosomal protein of 152 kDa-like isoform X2 [Cyphomyrmex costatus]
MEPGPGLSLFQGSDSIHINTVTQGLEEDEEQEDKRRLNEEIQNRLDEEFDDLENDDDISSINSSHQDNTRDTDHINMVNSGLESITPKEQVAVAHLQKEFGVYDRVENLNNYDHVDNLNSYDHDVITNHRSDSEIGSGTVQTDFDLYRQTGTPYGNNRFNDSNSIIETPYELAKPPTGYPRKILPQSAEERTFSENYSCNYETPSNHYNTHISHKYSNNGINDTYENNVQSKQIHEFGGGDNATSDHMNHCYKTSPNGRPIDDAVAYKTSEYNSKEQLEILYMVRMREISRLTEELQQLQMEKEDEKNQMSRRLMLLQAEVDRTNISRNQAQEALVDAKAEISDLQMQMKSLKERNAVLEKTNQNMTEDLNIARGSVMDLQQKIAVLERAQVLQVNDKIQEKFLKQAQEKHAVEMKNMQTQIDILTDKLNAKETSCVTLEHKLDDARRAHEALMVEKGDTMNRLAQALQDSQTQCRNLMTTNNVQQVMQLQAHVKMLIQEKEDLHKNVQDLQNKLELAKNEVAQYDSLLVTTLEDESDSIRQMKLGELYNKSKSKPVDDITNKLKGELRRCIAGQAVKRKEINRLENTLSQKEKELNEALISADTYRQETAQKASELMNARKRIKELEEELKSLLTDEAMKANAKIQKLSYHLNDVKKQYELLRDEKINLEQKLEEALAINQEKLRKMHQETTEQQEKEAVDEYNKEYLEIHAKAVERVKQEAHIEIVQLTVQLEQTQKELDRVKELYINVCGTKEHLINEHKNEIKVLKNKYAAIESHQKDMEKLENELQTQVKLCNKLTKECEDFKSKIIELEKDLVYERRKKEDHVKKIHSEIERAKEEALHELRNAHPNQEISFLLPDHCSEHLEKINQLEEDCKRLEEKLQIAVQEQKKLSDYQTELDDAKLKIAQMEITQESWKKKYEKIANERKDLLAKISKLDLELLNLKRTAKLEDSDDVKLKISRFQAENETLKNQYDNLISERNTCKEKISELETELFNAKKKVSNFEGRLRKSSESTLNSKSELEKELSHHKNSVAQLSKLSNSKEGRMNESMVLEQRIQQFEHDLRSKDEKLNRLLKEFEKIKDERDQLVVKLRNQAKQFEQFVKSQNKVSAELNLSPRSTGDSTDFQKMKEIMAKEVREEMEQRVAKELRGIGEQNRKELEELEGKYKTTILELQKQCSEKDQEIKTLQKEITEEKMKVIQISQIIGKVEICNKELQARRLCIEKLNIALKEKENQVEEDRNYMAEIMTKWMAELKESKAKEKEKDEEIQMLKFTEGKLNNELKTLVEKQKHLKNKYRKAKQTANNYKSHAENNREFLLRECKRIEEGYKKAIEEAQQSCLANDEQYTVKAKKLEQQHAQKMEQMQLTLKYKDKC